MSTDRNYQAGKRVMGLDAAHKITAAELIDSMAERITELTARVEELNGQRNTLARLHINNERTMAGDNIPQTFQVSLAAQADYARDLLRVDVATVHGGHREGVLTSALSSVRQHGRHRSSQTQRAVG